MQQLFTILKKYKVSLLVVALALFVIVPQLSFGTTNGGGSAKVFVNGVNGGNTQVTCGNTVSVRGSCVGQYNVSGFAYDDWSGSCGAWTACNIPTSGSISKQITDPSKTYNFSLDCDSSDGVGSWTDVRTATCVNPAPVCGNGVREGSEQCDLGSSNGSCPSTCSRTCTTNSCGGGGGGSGAPTVTISASPTTVTSGQSTFITWSSTNATYCTAIATPANANWSGTKSTAGGQTSSPLSQTTTFYVNCTGAGGTSGDKSVTVTVTVPPSTDDSTCAGLVAPDSVVAGSTFLASVNMHNSGTNGWISTGSYPYLLGSQNPQDNLTWGLGRVPLNGAPNTYTNGEPVNSGSNAIFNFTATAPTTAGTYAFEWQMVHEHLTWFGAHCSKNIVVTAPTPPPPPPETCTPTLNPDFVDVPPTHPNYQAVSCLRNNYCVVVGRSATMFYPDANTLRSEAPTFISRYHKYATQDWVWHQANPPSFSDVPFLYWAYNWIETAHFDQDGPGPKTPFILGYPDGTYQPDQDWLYGFCGIDSPCPAPGAATLRKNYVQQLYDYGMAHNQLPLCVTTPPAPNNASCSGITAPSTVVAGTPFSASVSMLNTGTNTWTQPNYKLGSQNPQDNQNWGSSRVLLPTASVAPNQTAVFNWTPTAPTTPGTYAFDWKMVQEGVQWYGTTCTKSILVTAPSSGAGTITLTATPSSLPFGGGNVTLSWVGSNVSACVASGDWSGNKASSGSEPQGTVTSNKSYTITCRDNTGALVSSNATVTVAAPTFSISLKINAGSGYASSAQGAIPVDLDFKSTTSGTANGPIHYLWYCNSSDSVPIQDETINTSATPDIREHLALCRYSQSGVYHPKVVATRNGITANDTATLTAARSCSLGMLEAHPGSNFALQFMPLDLNLQKLAQYLPRLNWQVLP